MLIILYLIIAAISGLIVGALARLILPGRDPMSIPQTILVGMAGSLAAGLFAYYVLKDRDGAGLLLSLVFATLFVWLIRKSRERSGSQHHARPTGRRGFSV